jgi:MSHA pilin protein MshC
MTLVRGRGSRPRTPVSAPAGQTAPGTGFEMLRRDGRWTSVKDEHQVMGRKSARFGSQAGFTLIELVMVIVLMGILCLYVAPHVFGVAQVNARGLHNETLAFLRYAQKTAIAQRRVVCLSFTPGSATLHINALPTLGACDTPLIGPTGGLPGTLTARAGATFSALPGDFNFNGLGQPVNAFGGALARQTLQVTGSGYAITVEASTGYVHD